MSLLNGAAQMYGSDLSQQSEALAPLWESFKMKMDDM